MARNVSRAIAALIYEAQYGSDAAKYLHRLPELEGTRRRCWNYGGYGHKAHCIEKAIKLIDSSKRCTFRYWAEKKPDQNGYPATIVYFETKVAGEVLQVSFHSPARETGITSHAGKGTKTTWTGVLDGSFHACEKIAQAYGLWK